jgi:two-component system response regulator AlgR
MGDAHHSTQPLRVLIAEPDPNLQMALGLVVGRMPHLQLVGQCQDVDELWQDLRVLHPDVIIVSLELPGLQTVRRLDALREISPRAVTIALGSRHEQRQSAVDAGALAFVSKSEAPDELLRTLESCGVSRGVMRED